MRIGALEGGGTKMVLAVGNENGEILERVSIPTKTPDVTIPEMVNYFKEKNIDALGIATFGPIDLNRASKTYGYITSTPKIAWQNYDFLGAFKKEFNIPIAFDTDVNGSALGEATWGTSKGLENIVYITVGTGVGMGIISNGKPLHGMLHPEGGHMLLAKHPDDTYKGKCPFHSNCLEGLAAGPAVEERWGDKAVNLSERKEVWELESYYIAQALTNIIMLLSPQKIILGGGIMHQTQLMPLIRKKTLSFVHKYIQTKELDNIDDYIVLPSLNDDQGIMGCIKLALNEMNL